MHMRDVRLVQGVICRTYFDQFSGIEDFQKKVRSIYYDVFVIVFIFII